MEHPAKEWLQGPEGATFLRLLRPWHGKQVEAGSLLPRVESYMGVLSTVLFSFYKN